MSRRTHRGSVRAFPADVRSYGYDDPAEPGDVPEPSPPAERGPGGGLRRPGRVDRTGAPSYPGIGEATVFAWALLPLRVFVGGTFLFAGLDKLFSPTFLSATGPGSIGQQIAGFERLSPLAPLIHVFGDPFPVLLGLGIALLEVAVGLGTLLGLLFRWAALAGAGLSFMFFLTASWATRPYYYGPDLPYMFGWITLALAGHGHLYTLEDWLERREYQQAAITRRASGRTAAGWARAGDRSTRAAVAQPDPSRRAFLQLGILAVGSIALATVARTWPFRGNAPATAAAGAGASADPNGGGIGLGGASPQASAAASAAPASSAAPAASAAPSAAAPAGTAIADVSAVKSQGAAMFQIPTTGDPGIVIDLKSGKLVAYDAVCTHQGCTVEFDSGSQLLFCPCHGAVYDPANQAQVLQGPAPRPLTSLPIKVDQANGKVYLQA